ncbi:MAG: SH3 domain-containing protein [Gammaproteobacteria bacterium]
MKYIIYTAVFLTLFVVPFASAKSSVDVIVEEPFIELRTGPGRGYPVFYVAEEGDTITITRRRTEWFEVIAPRGKKGWVHRDALELTLDPEGFAIRVEDSSFGSYSNRRFEIGVMDGVFGDVDVISLYGAYSFTPNLSAELAVSQGIGTFADNVFATANVVHNFFPDKRVTPFFTLGGGMLRTSPNATLVEVEDRNDEIAFAGLGIRAYATRRMMLRLEYKTYVIFTSRDDNQEIDEWKAGFSFFF